MKNVQKITRAMEMVAAARLRRAEQRIDALRPYARRAPQDDPPGRRGGRGGGAEPARAPGARRGATTSASSWSRATAAWPARSTRRSSGRASSCSASCVGTAPRSVFSVVGRRGVSTMRVPRRGAPRRVRRLHRPAGVRERAGDRREAVTSLRRRGARPGRADLQPLRLAAHPVRLAPDAAADPAGRGLRGGGGGRGRREPRRATPSWSRRTARRSGTTSRSPRSCSPSCFPSTRSSPSTGRCSSRPLRSTARG